MGIFRAAIGMEHPGGGDTVGVSGVVDTDAAHTMLPESLLTQLRIRLIVE